MNLGRRTIGVLAGLLALPLLLTLVGFVLQPPRSGPWLEPARSARACIRPREEMRYGHMVHLRALRDKVVREGSRSALGGQGMTACRGCHEHREAFCDRCHRAAGVSPDCFGCHAY